jgi:hypothetical protein
LSSLSFSLILIENQNQNGVFAFFMERRERAQESWSGGCFLFLFISLFEKLYDKKGNVFLRSLRRNCDTLKFD